MLLAMIAALDGQKEDAEVRNFVQPGNVITVIAPTGGVQSGAVVIVGAIVGIAATTQPAGAEVEVSVEGVFDISKVVGDSLPQGAVAKVTPATGLVGVAGTVSIGLVVEAAAAGASTARVRLTPSVAGTPTTLEAPPPEHAHAGARRRE